MPVIKQERQVLNAPIGVTRINTGATEKWQSISAAADTLSDLNYDEKSKIALRYGEDEAMSVRKEQLNTIDPATGKTVAMNVARADMSQPFAPNAMGAIAHDAYRNIINRRFETSVNDELMLAAKDIAAKHRNPAAFDQEFSRYIAEMSNNSEAVDDTRYQVFIEETGAAYLAATRANLAAAAASAAAARVKSQADLDLFRVIRSAENSATQFDFDGYTESANQAYAMIADQFQSTGNVSNYKRNIENMDKLAFFGASQGLMAASNNLTPEMRAAVVSALNDGTEVSAITDPNIRKLVTDARIASRDGSGLDGLASDIASDLQTEMAAIDRLNDDAFSFAVSEAQDSIVVNLSSITDPSQQEAVVLALNDPSAIEMAPSSVQTAIEQLHMLGSRGDVGMSTLITQIEDIFAGREAVGGYGIATAEGAAKAGIVMGGSSASYMSEADGLLRFDGATTEQGADASASYLSEVFLQHASQALENNPETLDKIRLALLNPNAQAGWSSISASFGPHATAMEALFMEIGAGGRAGIEDYFSQINTPFSAVQADAVRVQGEDLAAATYDLNARVSSVETMDGVTPDEIADLRADILASDQPNKTKLLDDLDNIEAEMVRNRLTSLTISDGEGGFRNPTLEELSIVRSATLGGKVEAVVGWSKLPSELKEITKDLVNNYNISPSLFNTAFGTMAQIAADEDAALQLTNTRSDTSRSLGNSVPLTPVQQEQYQEDNDLGENMTPDMMNSSNVALMDMLATGVAPDGFNRILGDITTGLIAIDSSVATGVFTFMEQLTQYNHPSKAEPFNMLAAVMEPEAYGIYNQASLLQRAGFVNSVQEALLTVQGYDGDMNADLKDRLDTNNVTAWVRDNFEVSERARKEIMGILKFQMASGTNMDEGAVKDYITDYYKSITGEDNRVVGFTINTFAGDKTRFARDFHFNDDEFETWEQDTLTSMYASNPEWFRATADPRAIDSTLGSTVVDALGWLSGGSVNDPNLKRDGRILVDGKMYELIYGDLMFKPMESSFIGTAQSPSGNPTWAVGIMSDVGTFIQLQTNDPSTPAGSAGGLTIPVYMEAADVKSAAIVGGVSASDLTRSAYQKYVMTKTSTPAGSEQLLRSYVEWQATLDHNQGNLAGIGQNPEIQQLLNKYDLTINEILDIP